MTENPVYHLTGSSLEFGKLNNYYFSFDTADQLDDAYVINYSYDRSSSETHGIENYDSRAFKGESHETSKIIIDKKSFAIKKIERAALRYPGYSYSGKPNFVMPGKKYFAEFINGKLVAEYEPVNGKWYLKKMDHQYTNEYFNAVSGMKSYISTNFYEWNSDSVSRYITGDMVNSFYPKMSSPEKYSYDKAYWSNNDFPFYFANKDSVYADLEKNGPLEDQFYRNHSNKKE